MADVPTTHQTVRFGVFQLNGAARELRKHGVKVRLPGQAFAILELLLERSGDVVTREDLRKRLWPDDIFVDFEQGLNAAMRKLRVALGDSAESPRYIETLPRIGYRFVAPVRESAETPAAAVSPDSGGTPGLLIAEPIRDTASAEAPLGSSKNGRSNRAALYTTLVLVLLALSWVAYRESLAERTRPALPTGKIMLAVLPFDNLTGDPASEYLSDGLTEELITELGSIRPDRLGVIARTSVMGYKHTDKRVDQIGRELGVIYVLEGSLRQAGDRVRVTAQLIRVSDQAHVWAQEFDSDLRDVLVMEADVARKIAAGAQVQLGKREATPPRVDPEAYELVLKGRYLWSQRTDTALHHAIKLFEQAIQKDPSYAQAYAGLADSYVLLNDAPPIEVSSKAREAAKKALELNPDLAAAHASLALIGPDGPWDWPGAQREFLRALALDPNYATAHHWYGDRYLSSTGRLDEALTEIRIAEQLDPLSPIIATDVAKQLYCARRFPEAYAQLQKVFEISPNYPMALYWTRWLQVSEGKYNEASATLEREKPTLPPERYLIGKAYLLAQTGHPPEARALLAQILQISKAQYIDPGDIAAVYFALNDRDNGFLWLDKAYQSESRWLTTLNVMPLLAPLHSDPRFIDLIHRAGL